MKVTPIGTRILVKMPKPEEVTQGGIVLPDSVTKNTQDNRGVIVAVARHLGESFKIGSTVIYSRFAGNDIEIDGEKHLFLDMKDILGVVE